MADRHAGVFVAVVVPAIAVVAVAVPDVRAAPPLPPETS
jgi:hypothetical protein